MRHRGHRQFCRCLEIGFLGIADSDCGVEGAGWMVFLLADSAAERLAGALLVGEVNPRHDTRPEKGVCETVRGFSSGFDGSGG